MSSATGRQSAFRVIPIEKGGGCPARRKRQEAAQRSAGAGRTARLLDAGPADGKPEETLI